MSEVKMDHDLIECRHGILIDDEPSRALRTDPPTGSFDPALPLSDTYCLFRVGLHFVAVELAEVEGQARPVRIEIRGYASASDSSAAPISTTVVRQMRLGELVEVARRNYLSAAREMLSEYPEKLHWDEADREAAIRIAERQIAASAPTRSSGRPRLAEDEVAETARIYRAASRMGISPRAEVAAELNLSLSGASKRIRRARDLGYIPPSGRVPKGRSAKREAR